MYLNFIKPFLDTLLALFLLLFTFPIIIALWLILRFQFSSNPVFKQIRPGLNEKMFTIFKFKSMTDAKDKEGNLLSDKVRLTSTGALIRKLSLDELPQLINVLKGDMSFVGPRPLLPEYLPLYNNHQKRRHDVRPGITGWAQVNGRNTISWEEKFNLDVWYVDHQSFSLDLKILLKTIIKVLRKDGVSSQTSVTMEKFRGTS